MRAYHGKINSTKVEDYYSSDSLKEELLSVEP